nr:immunoglobulin heavy chain junction region [Mus musculus]MBK4186441.1 immunoglobulin heavy chain junction region [Mus musculus]
CARGGAWFAYW